MSSGRRVPNVALARRLVDGQFPQWAGLPIEEVELDGWDNRTFRLGDELTLRLPTGDWYAQQVDKEQRWLPVLASDLPLPIPVPVARGAPAEGYPYAWSVYRWLEGEPATAFEVARRVFPDELSDHQLRFALAETLAHLEHLVDDGGVERLSGEVERYHAV